MTASLKLRIASQGPWKEMPQTMRSCQHSRFILAKAFSTAHSTPHHFRRVTVWSRLTTITNSSFIYAWLRRYSAAEASEISTHINLVCWSCLRGGQVQYSQDGYIAKQSPWLHSMNSISGQHHQSWWARLCAS